MLPAADALEALGAEPEETALAARTVLSLDGVMSVRLSGVRTVSYPSTTAEYSPEAGAVMVCTEPAVWAFSSLSRPCSSWIWPE